MKFSPDNEENPHARLNHSAAKRPNLRWRIITVLLAVSILPLLLMGVGAWFVFGRILEEKSLELQRTVVESHAGAIETYLADRIKSLRLFAETQGLEELTQAQYLSGLFDCLNRTSNNGFIDIGVIDSEGNHLAYVGPYDLLDKNYRDAEWFKEVEIQGRYISDVFLGFRNVPHCVIAVKSGNGSKPWFLRATINSDQMDAFVSAGMLGETGDAYIVNRAGLYQTTPRDGSLLEQSPFKNPAYFKGVQNRKEMMNGSLKIQVTTWLNQNNWLLVAQQDAWEIRAPVNRAVASGAVIVVLAMGVIVITTYLATRHLTRQIDRANARREEMFHAFMRSAKLASIGELATGLAHEINNPLAIISADQTNISDIIAGDGVQLPEREELALSLNRIKRQVARCKSITTKMLQFGRKRETELEPTDIAAHLGEIVAMLKRQAEVRNAELNLQIEEDLPPAMVDPVELEQVIVNLIQNSLHALPQGGAIDISCRVEGNELVIENRDNGKGIPPKAMERIFEPFFTTKPVGEGTGLGLSVVYGIVQSWNGQIRIDSEPGKGTVVRISIPLQ